MTEKECLKALDCLYDEDVFDKEVWGFVMEGDNLSCADVERAKKYYRDKIYNLIKEHFDNPPLFLSDLEDEETYWHMDYGWIRIKNIISYDCIVISTLTSDGYMRISFEEDMFYRKCVEDE